MLNIIHVISGFIIPAVMMLIACERYSCFIMFIMSHAFTEQANTVNQRLYVLGKIFKLYAKLKVVWQIS